jgi:hypothetical protein
MPASKAQQAVTAKRRANAIALKLAGMDFETIAERLGYSDPGAARKDFWRAVQKNRIEEKQAVDDLREVEGQRLDRLQAAVWAKAVKGDIKAVETVLKVISQRARLFGLDAPVKAEVSGPGGGPLQLGPATTAELEALISLGRSDLTIGEAEGRDAEDGARDA